MIFDFLKFYTFWKLRNIIINEPRMKVHSVSTYTMTILPANGNFIRIEYDLRFKKYYLNTVSISLFTPIELKYKEALDYLEQV